MIKGCIFDLDGVLVDTARYHFKAWKKLADQLGINFTREDNEKMKGISRKASLERLLELGNMELSEARRDELCDLKNSWYLSLVDNMDEGEILSGVIEFLTDLEQRDISMALGSASKNAKTIMSKTGLSNYISVIVDGNDVKNSKPDPEVFLLGARKLELSPSKIVVFEDSAKGIEAAIAGGFKTIGIGSTEHLSNADLVLEDLTGFNTEKLLNHFK